VYYGYREMSPQPSRTFRSLALASGLVAFVCSGAVELFNNGPLITHPGAGLGGANVSAIQTTLGSQLPGYGIQWPGNNHIADDFTVPAGGWVVSSATVYTYQLNTGSSSSMSEVRCRIWNGKPGETGSQVIWGTLSTNVLLNSTFSGIYRAPEGNLLAADKAIMANTINIGVALSPGVYWLEFSAEGRQQTGPWAPPVTRQGLPGSGNAVQFYGSDQQWHPAFDNGGSWTDDVPFVLLGQASGQQTIAANAYSVAPGSLVSGSISDLATSNDIRMNFRPGPVLVSSQRPLQIVLEGTLSNPTASQLQFVLESSASVANINQQIEIFNFSLNQYDAVSDSRTLQTADQTVQVDILTPNQHIGAGNKVRVRVSAKANGAVLIYPWLTRLDRAIWLYTP